MLEPNYLYFDIPAGVAPAHRIACYQWGNPKAARTVVCVHGLTRNGCDFDYLAQKLAKDYQVLCPDMPGRGRSDWLTDPAGYTNAVYIADVVFMLASLGITQVDWIGTSMGGIMAMMAANLHKGLINHLVLNDIGAVIPASGVARIRDIADFKTCYDSRAEAEDVFRKRTATFGVKDEAQWQHLLAHGLEERGSQTCFNYDPAIFSAGFSKDAPLADIDLWGLWPAITHIPTLLIRGETSDILTHETAIEMGARHSNLRLQEIPGVGHAPALMDAEQIMLICQWLSDFR